MTSFRLFVSYAGSLALRFLLSPLKLLPIQKDRVLFVSFRGKQYSCNPRAVSEAMEKTASGRVRIEWAFHEPEKFKYIAGRGITVLDDRSLKFILHAMTARVVCTNTYYKPFLPRRKDQFYLRTWHGGGAYKKVTYPSGLRGKYISMQQQGASLYLSSSRAFTDQTLRGAFGYTGEVLEAGMPRNDILTDGRWKETALLTKRELGLSDRKIALYAPTYRYKQNASSGEHIVETRSVDMDYSGVYKALKERFGGEWMILLRLHPGREEDAHKMTLPDFVLNATDHPDGEELCAACDVMFSDYSSIMFEPAFVRKPVFLLATDRREYIDKEYDLLIDYDSLPFPIAESNEDLIRNIIRFDEREYVEKIDAFMGKYGINEDGHASERAAQFIMDLLEKKS